MHQYFATFDLDGHMLDRQGTMIQQSGYRLDTQTAAALAFLKRHHDQPFFLYLAYFGPHVPLEATEKYLARFPGKMPQRRRYALAMLSAIDDGVGRLTAALKQYGISDNTLIFFSSDNGAPLGAHQGQPMADVLPAGSEVLAPENHGTWTYCTLPDGTTRAWVPTDTIEKVKPG